MRKSIIIIIILTAAFCLGNNGGYCGEKIPIRVGWQTSWATQGQIAVILKDSNILQLNGLQGEFKGFSYGGPLNEGALSGAVDVIFTADQPACMLLAKGAKWKIIGRLIYNRVATIVPPDSVVRETADLKGKIIGIPFGAAAQRETLKALKEVGLDPAADVDIRNIGIYEEMNVIQAGDNKQWGKFAAFATWDPPLAELEYAKRARAVDYGLVTSVIVMSEEFIERNPSAARDFLQAYISAFYYYAKHQKEANILFKNESKLGFDLGVLDLAASVEPNLKVNSLQEIDIGLSDEDIAVIQSGADFIYEQDLTDTHIENIRDYIDLQYLEEAEKAIGQVDETYLGGIQVQAQ